MMTRSRDALYKGLNDEQVLASKARFGENVYLKKKKKSILKRFFENLNDPIVRVLLIAMGVNLLFTIRNINWVETAGIVIAVLISSIVSTLSEYGSEKAFEKMQETQKNRRVVVLRNGAAREISAEELVVGDAILLSPGEMIAADGKLIKGMLKVDESAINGESAPAPKTADGAETKNSLFAGSLIVEGEGLMQVTAVGQNSLYGQIAGEIQQEDEPSPLKNRLSKLASTISKIGYLAAALVALTYLFGEFVVDAHFVLPDVLMRLSNLRYVAMTLMKAVTIAITVVVVAVPEGLPMMISVVLSANIKRMLKDQVLVRKPVGIETAGSINILFTDKTGTLTEGKLRCKELVFGDGSRYNGKSPLKGLSVLLEGSLLINNSCKRTDKGYLGGNPTEQALAVFLNCEKEIPEADDKILFESKNKYSCARVRSGIYKGVYIKGAPEKILPFCSSCYDQRGQRVGFDRCHMQDLIARLSKRSCRIVAFAMAERMDAPQRAGEMTFLCIAVLKDGVRRSAPQAVKDLQGAGVSVVMITGDSKDTARAVAKECGILDGGRDLVIDGEELAVKSDRELVSLLNRIAVVARALPKDKSRLVRLAKEQGMVVGMTGDGINDAPALKKADVGFAMGSGTDIAKEAGDIVILDNNLSSIVNAVLYGRTIFKSIRKFITFQLTMNLCAVGVSFFGQILGIESPITVIQMLWVNIIMDTLGGLAFAGEYPLRMYLKEQPIGREEPILSKRMLWQTLIMGVFGTVLCTSFLASDTVRTLFSYEKEPMHLLTAFFALFIFTGIAICFTTRSERLNLGAGLSKNKLFILIMAVIVLVQLLMLYFGGQTFRCCGLSFKGLLLVNACSLTVIPIDLLRRIAIKMLKKRVN
ncbi:MAG: calcium-translocating P-type ATPase, PMCA-type [Clostridia bacterium]|nr:calcium-translocating P-type ATPase, PMCA-type [Clostridia bacterium]